MKAGLHLHNIFSPHIQRRAHIESTGIKKYSSLEMRWHTVTQWRGSEEGNWRMQWVAITLHTTSEHAVSSMTTADAHTSVASSRLN